MIPNNLITAKELDEIPSGYRGLGQCLHETHRAYLFQYYGHEVWIPKKVLVKAEGGFWAPPWTIESSKKHQAGHSVDWGNKEMTK